MSMHLVGPYMTTTRYNRKKSKKLTDAQLEKLRVEWRAYNKDMRRSNCHSAQFTEFEDYVAYTRGQYKPKAQKNVENVQKYAQKSVEPYRRETPDIPSLGNGIDGYAPKKESIKYTGDLIVGIGTMHKSNAVPIMRGTKQAEEIASMRR